MAGTSMTPVPYKGSGPAAADLLAGRISMSFDSIAVYKDYIVLGKLRALGVTTLNRSDALPSVPTIAEAGLPGYDISNWLGVLVPAGTPPAIIARLNAEIRHANNDAEMKKQLLAVGIEAGAFDAGAFAQLIRAISRSGASRQDSGARSTEEQWPVRLGTSAGST